MVGRPTKYKEEYCEEIIKFFNVEPYREVEVTRPSKDGPYKTFELRANDLPTFGMFAVKIDVNVDTLREWCKHHKEFSAAYKRCKDIQEFHLMTNGLNNLYHGSFAIFTAKNVINWRDQQYLESKVESKIEAKIQVEEADLSDRISQVEED